MKTSQTIGKLAAAIARAQAAMQNPVFDAVNPHFNSRYATLAAVRNAVIPALSTQGVAVMQSATSTERGIRVHTLLAHSDSGEWIETDGVEVPVAKEGAHNVVAATTYGKRVDLQSVTCVCGDADDDGNHAESNPPPPRAKAKAAAVSRGSAAEAEWIKKIADCATLQALAEVGTAAKAAGCMSSEVIGAGKRRKGELELEAMMNEPLRGEGEDGEAQRMSAETVAALEGKPPSARSAAAAKKSALMAAIETETARTAGECMTVITGLVSHFGSEAWARLVRDGGGTIAAPLYGFEGRLDGLRALAQKMIDAMPAKAAP